MLPTIRVKVGDIRFDSRRHSEFVLQDVNNEILIKDVSFFEKIGQEAAGLNLKQY